MRVHFLLALLFLTAAGHAGAQATDQFWGMTSAGGTDNAGTIFSTNNDGTGLTVRHQFPYTTTGPLIGGTHFTELGGKLYGVGEYGGKRDYILFSYNPATGAVVRLHDFEHATGTQPLASLTVFNGKLYGTTYVGGTSNPNDIAGTIFEYDPATSTYTKKTEFVFTNGASPENSLITAPTGDTPLVAEDPAFTAVKAGSKAVLRWNCSGTQAKYYTVERSADAAMFETLGTVPGAASGNCDFVDAAPVGEKNFYRLRLEKESGAMLYSEVKRLDFLTGASSARLLNTAAAGGRIGVETSAGGHLRIVSAVGAEVVRTRVEGGVVWVNVSGLATGVYGVVMDGVWVGRIAVTQ